MQRHVHQGRVVRVGPADLDEKHLHLLSSPLEAPRQRRHGDGLEAVLQNPQPVSTDRLQIAVLSPGSDRNGEHPLLDVDEAGVAHHVLQPPLRDGVEVDAQRGEGPADHVPVLRYGMFRVHRTAVHERVVQDLLDFYPASGPEVSTRRGLAH